MFTAADKRKAAQREVSLRKFVYPNRVAARKMTQAQADREIAIMIEIASDYLKLEQDESPSLFANKGPTDGDPRCR